MGENALVLVQGIRFKIVELAKTPPGVVRRFTAWCLLTLVAMGGCNREPPSSLERKAAERVIAKSMSKAATDPADADATADLNGSAANASTLERFIKLLEASDAGADGREAQVEFRAVVIDIESLAGRGIPTVGIPVGGDWNSLLTVELRSAKAPISELPMGTTIRFLVHSPVRVFGIEDPVGKTYDLTMTFQKRADGGVSAIDLHGK